MKLNLSKIFRWKTLGYLAYLLASSAALLLILELALWGLDAAGVGEFPTLAQSDYPQNPDEYIKIAIFGESAARGFGAERSFEDILRYELANRYPTQKFYIRNYARPSFTFHGYEAEIAKANIQRYDIFLIYAGHNELHVYLDRVGYFRKPEFKDCRVVHPMPGDDLSAWRRLLDYHSRLFALVAQSKQHRLTAAAERGGGMEREVRFPAFAPAGVLPADERARIDQDFRSDLEEIARLAQRYGKQVIVLSAAGREDWKPVFSVRNASLPADASQAWQAHFEQGQALYQQQQFAEALQHFRAAWNIDPGVAVLNYMLGKTHAALKNSAESKRYFRLAIDSDGYPARAFTSLADIGKAVAEKYPNVHYREMLATFEELVNRGCSEKQLFVDIQHPSLTGHCAIAQVFLDEIAAFDAFRSQPVVKVNLDKASLEQMTDFYATNLRVSPVDRAETAMERAQWFMGMAEHSPDPNDYLEKAVENLALIQTVVGDKADGRAYYESGMAALRRARAKMP